VEFGTASQSGDEGASLTDIPRISAAGGVAAGLSPPVRRGLSGKAPRLVVLDPPRSGAENNAVIVEPHPILVAAALAEKV